MSSTSFQTTTPIIDDESGATTITAIPSDITLNHILTRLDSAALASAASTCSQLHALSSHEPLWAYICHSTWPSTNTPRVRHVISSFTHGSRSFFSDSFPTATAHTSRAKRDWTPEIISAVDIFHGQNLLLSKVVETETESGWFRLSPFRVDLLDPKNAVQTPISYPKVEDACDDIGEGLRVSWIVIDSRGGRAVNVSSREPVSVQPHWLSGEVDVRFATVFGGGERGSASELVLCDVTVTCSRTEEDLMQVREVCLHMENLDGIYLNGRDSLGILQRVLEGERGKNEGKNCYDEFMKRKKERKEWKVRSERMLDMLSVTLTSLLLASISYLFLFSN